MTYQVEFTDTAENDLAHLDRTITQRVLDKLRWLANNAELVQHKSLTAQLSGAFSMRVGHYRAIYSLDRTDLRIIVHSIRHRREVYRIN